ncbi:MAG TPA: hypothetical protein VIA09_01060 [Nitrososphaeraceae archaeon]|jgi:hypothetical protein
MVILNNLALLSMLSVIVILISLPSLLEGQGNATESNVPKFIAIQHADSGLISQINDTAYSLELNNVSHKTILFSDRPDRIIMTINANDFIGNWTYGQDNFQMDPPNVALIGLAGDKEQDVFEAILYNPVYEKDQNSLRYDVTLLGNATINFDIPMNLEKPVLVIDEQIFSMPSGEICTERDDC